MKASTRIGLMCLAALSSCLPALAVSYIWTGAGAGNPKFWTDPANWSPSTGYPVMAGDKAYFRGSSNASCVLTRSVTLAEMWVEQRYGGEIRLSFMGQIAAGRLQLASGKLVNDPEMVIATENLVVSAGAFADLTCLGTATISGGNIGVLRMRGPDARLEGIAGFVDPYPLGSLLIPEGKCTVTQAFTTSMLAAGAGVTLLLSQSGALSTMAHSLAGTIRLEPNSAMTFLTDASIGGTIDASLPGSVITCNGNWSMPGTFISGGTAANRLVINQTVSSGTVDHGSNPADAVVIVGAAGQKTSWVSTNTISQLMVSSGSTLEVARSSVLSVAGPMVNSGRIQEIAPGHIHHNVEELIPVDNSGVALQTLPVNGSFRIRLKDADEALQAELPDAAEGITVLNNRNGDLLRLSATETGNSSAIFLTPLITTQYAADATADDLLQLLPGDSIAIGYTDNEDPQDRQIVALQAGGGTTTTTAPSTSTTSTVTTTTRVSTSSTTSTSTTTGGSTTTTTLAPAGPSRRLEFAHLAAGGGYQSFLVISNPNGDAVQGLATFRAQDGQPLLLQINGEPTVSALFIVPARGTIRLRLQSAGQQVRVGWCRVTSDLPIGGLLIYQSLNGPELVSEATVLPSARLRHFSIPVPQLGFLSDTGLAIANADSEGADISLRFYASDGRLLDQAAFRQQAGWQAARFIAQFFAALPAGAEGSVEVQSTGEVIAVGLLYQGAVFTTLPILPLP